LAILEREREAGRPSPLDDRPELPADLGTAYSAFWQLSTTRTVTMAGPMRIQPSEAVALFVLLGIPEDERAELWALVQGMDAEWMKLYAARRPKGGPSGNHGHPSGQHRRQRGTPGR
jgi:hypothetical protein